MNQGQWINDWRFLVPESSKTIGAIGWCVICDCCMFLIKLTWFIIPTLFDIVIASIRLSVMLSPPKPLDEIQPNLVCELLTWMGHATEHLFWDPPAQLQSQFQSVGIYNGAPSTGRSIKSYVCDVLGQHQLSMTNISLLLFEESFVASVPIIFCHMKIAVTACKLRMANTKWTNSNKSPM